MMKRRLGILATLLLAAVPLAAQSAQDTAAVRAKRDSLAAEGTTGLTTRYRLIHELLQLTLKAWGVAPAPPAPVPPPPPPPPATGERVRLLENENVFVGPGIGTGMLGTQRAGALGNRIGGCQAGEGWRWCPVNWDTGPDGWVLEHKLAPASGTPPPPVPPPAPPPPAPVPPPPSGGGILFADDFESGNLDKYTLRRDHREISSVQRHSGTYAVRSDGEGELNVPIPPTQELWIRSWHSLDTNVQATAGGHGTPPIILDAAGNWALRENVNLMPQGSIQLESNPGGVGGANGFGAQAMSAYVSGYNWFAGRGTWFCLEQHAKLNDPGQANGVSEVYVNGTRLGGIIGNLRGTYPLLWNAVDVQSYSTGHGGGYWYVDDVVVSTARVGCGASVTPPPTPVPPPPAPPPSSNTGLWPNEPAGFTTIVETSWETAPLGRWNDGDLFGWRGAFRDGTKWIGFETISDSRLGENRALVWTVPANHAGGGGAEVKTANSFSYTKVYTGMYWKVSDNWYGHPSSIFKLIHIRSTGETPGDMWLEANSIGDQGGLINRVINQFPNTNPFSGGWTSGSTPRGRWHLIESVIDMTARTLTVWVNGTPMPLFAWTSNAGAPTAIEGVWIAGMLGGMGPMSNPAEQKYAVDRVRVSYRP